MSLRMLNRLPEIAMKIRNEYNQNKEIQKQLDIVADGLKYEQSDNLELEVFKNIHYLRWFWLPPREAMRATVAHEKTVMRA